MEASTTGAVPECAGDCILPAVPGGTGMNTQAISSSARTYTSRMVERIVPISTIRAHPDNPRMHPESQIAQLQASHEDLGQFEPCILWQRPDGYIQVKGHGYLEGVKLTEDEAIKA